LTQLIPTLASALRPPQQVSQLSRHGHRDQPQRCSRKYQAQDTLPDAGLRPEKYGAKITNKQASLPYCVSPRMLSRQMALLDMPQQDLTAWGTLALRALQRRPLYFNEIKHFPALRAETFARNALIAA
jgi:hypothetical protein